MAGAEGIGGFLVAEQPRQAGFPSRRLLMSRSCRWLSGVCGILLAALPAQAADEGASRGIRIDKQARSITIDAKVAPRKLEYLKGEIYPIEVIACWPHPRGKKAHETVVTIDVKPSAIHKAMESLGIKPGTPVMGESKQPPQGPEVKLFIEVMTPEGKSKRIPIDKTLIDPKTKLPLPKSVRWRFTGSVLSKPDPNKPETVYGADLTGTLIAIFPVTNETVFQTNLTMKEEKYLKLETNPHYLPKEGTLVKLVIVVPVGK
jgi:hypothetical protein